MIRLLLAATLLLHCAALQAQHWVRSDTPLKASLPKHLASWAQLPPGSVTVLQRVVGKQAEPGWVLQLDAQRAYRAVDLHEQRHGNGDRSLSGPLQGWGAAYWVLHTEGRSAGFALLQTPHGRYALESWGERAWLLALDDPRIESPAVGQDALGDAQPAPSRGKAAATIDVLFAYTGGFAERYPGDATLTRIEHLVALANQGLANSAVDLQLRLVGSERVSYDETGSNGAALADLSARMQGAPVPGLNTLQQRRIDSGADLVTLVRPHDIEVRGSCGIAYLFENRPERGVNVVSDGFSGWSQCSPETYMHEVGHNLGAEHQAGASSPQAGFGQAFIALGRFHTVMGSFGTGSPDRGLRLLRFSNPQQRCGGSPCGVDNSADNARRLRDSMAAVAAYQPSRSNLPRPALTPIDPDEDGDGVVESLDAFPHDPRYREDSDADGAADEVDAFPADRNEQRDLDGDGVGDRADPDRDGDGEPNTSDLLPDDPNETRDADGDGIGDNRDAFDADRAESDDSDADGLGDLADEDADGDGAPDFGAGFDVLLHSAGNDRVLRLDGTSGLLAQVEVVGEFVPQAFGSLARLLWDPRRERWLASYEAGISRFRQAPDAQRERWLAPPAGQGVANLPGAFPSGLAFDAEHLYVSDLTLASLARFDRISGRARPGGLFGQAGGLPQPPRDLQAGGEGQLWVLLRDGALLEVDTVTASARRLWTVEQVFGTPQVDISVFVRAADGALWLADRRGDRIWRFDPLAGSARVVISGGGLRQPEGLAFTPGGDLLVSSLASNALLRFAADGRALGEFSQLAPGTLIEPRALAIVPKVGDRYPQDPTRQFRVVLGGWWNPQRSGHGLEIARVGEQLAVTWYSYDASGRPIWYQGLAAQRGARWEAELLRYRWQDGRAVASPAGRAELIFSSEQAAEFRWQLGSASGSEPMQPLPVGRSSSTQQPTAAWFDPSESGWGLSLGRQAEVAYVLVFYYRQDGTPSWALGATPYNAQQMRFELQQTFGPTRCPGCSGAAEPAASAIGSLDFNLGGRASAADLQVDARADGLDWRRSGRAFQPLTEFPTDALGRPLPDAGPPY